MSGDEKPPALSPPVASNGQVAVRQEITAADESADTRLRVWFALRNLRHDALLQVYDCGTATVNDESIIYCVREASDGDFENALASEPLHTDAVLELVGALLRALAYLHAHGLVCLGIAPSEIHACGTRTKLFPQRLQHETAPAERAIDLRSLGELIVKAASRLIVEAR